jgi:hypothetical protein
MEEQIKNFDRGVERLMNEHEVTPPFGMWNRISAELDALPVAAGVAPTSFIPKRAIVGFIAGAMILGASLITGYLVHSANQPEARTPVQTVTPVSTPVAATTASQPASEMVATAPVAVMHHKVLHHVQAKPVEENAGPAQTTASNTNTLPVVITSPVTSNLNSDVPAPIETVSQNINEPQTYYFPPIDISNTEKSNAEHISAAKAHELDSKPADDDRPRAEVKMKWRPKKHGAGFSYGKINKVK